MFLKRTVIKNFRCHKDLTVEFSQNPFYISGGNGSGKTSIAEAVYTLLTLRSFRKINIKDAISYGEDNLRISAVFDMDRQTDTELVYFYSDARRLMIDGVETNTAADFSHIVPIVCYSPGFETLFSSDQQERRSSLDRIIYYLDKKHVEAVKLYNALISRKRAELIAEKPDKEVLSAIDDRLAPISKNISQARMDIIKLINDGLRLDPLYEKLLPGINLALDASPMKRDPAELKAKRPLDGCHKDLLYLKKDGAAVEKFQSFGQKKSALLFILHQVSKIIEKFREQGIILILDDFEAGLDKNRINLFEGLLPNSDGLNRQVILTGVELPIGKAALALK
jgi:DNA replication and repair protein RecF